MKYNKETYDMVSTSTSTSRSKECESYENSINQIQHYNYEQFKQVSLQNTFNELYHKYKKADVRKVFSPQQIESSIQHVVSKVKEFTVLSYAEDQQIRVEDVAGDREKRKKRGWSDDDDSSVDSEKISSESESDDGSPYGRKPRPPQQEIKWYDRLTSEDTLKLVTVLMNSHVWDFGQRIRKLCPESKRSNEHICSFCPFNKEFHPYFESCGVMPLICKYDLECTNTKTICYSANTGLKQHCIINDQDLGHKMLLFILKQLYEGRPSPYGPTEPTKNVIELQDTFETEKKKKLFHVKR